MPKMNSMDNCLADIRASRRARQTEMVAEAFEETISASSQTLASKVAKMLLPLVDDPKEDLLETLQQLEKGFGLWTDDSIAPGVTAEMKKLYKQLKKEFRSKDSDLSEDALLAVGRVIGPIFKVSQPDKVIKKWFKEEW